MPALILLLLLLLGSPTLAPAQPKSAGPLDLEYKQRAPALRSVPPRKVEEDTAEAVRELDRQRTERMLRNAQPSFPRNPNLDRDVTQGIQSRGLGRR
jgi:hypothetical protein